MDRRHYTIIIELFMQTINVLEVYSKQTVYVFSLILQEVFPCYYHDQPDTAYLGNKNMSRNSLCGLGDKYGTIRYKNHSK